MAWIFSLSAECGPQQEAAEAIAGHFQGLAITLADRAHHPCTAHTFHDGEGWWAMVCPEGVSMSSIQNEQDEREMTEIGFFLYERLKSAPPFRFAIVGVEADEFRTFRELDTDMISLGFHGLVLAESVWQGLGSPNVFVPFAPGYRWRPFVRAR